VTPFTTLQQAPVIVVSVYRSHVIIVHRTDDPVLIPLPEARPRRNHFPLYGSSIFDREALFKRAAVRVERTMGEGRRTCGGTAPEAGSAEEVAHMVVSHIDALRVADTCYRTILAEK